MHNKTKQSKAKQSKAEQSRAAKQSIAKQSKEQHSRRMTTTMNGLSYEWESRVGGIYTKPCEDTAPNKPEAIIVDPKP